MANNYNENAIREAAYYLWQNAGCPNGNDQQYWAMAIEQLSCNNSCNCTKSSSSSKKCSTTSSSKTAPKKTASSTASKTSSSSKKTSK